MKKDKIDPQKLVPYGLLATRTWLKSKGVERHTLDNWIKSGRLSSIVTGVLKRPDARIPSWQGIVCSLQMMGSNLIPGGITALELQGFAHYLTLSKNRTIQLYGTDKLPAWLNKILPDTRFIRHSEQQLFSAVSTTNKTDDKKSEKDQREEQQSRFTTTITWGIDEWPLAISTPERAFFELLLDVPEHLSFEHADQIMQGLVSLSPRRINQLMERCTSIKVKRLFLWLAEKNHHPWTKKLDWQRFNMQSGALGAGKRMIVKGGKLDPKYLITIPKDLYGSQ